MIVETIVAMVIAVLAFALHVWIDSTSGGDGMEILSFERFVEETLVLIAGVSALLTWGVGYGLVVSSIVFVFVFAVGFVVKEAILEYRSD